MIEARRRSHQLFAEIFGLAPRGQGHACKTSSRRTDSNR
jgi:hypothetical protein